MRGSSDDASSTVGALGVRADTLFLRTRDVDWGVGPYVQASSVGARGVDAGVGASLLVPVHPYLPIVVSAGVYDRVSGEDRGAASVGGSLFWGSRGFNYHASYSLAAGVLLEARRGVSAGEPSTVGVSVQLDLGFFALPVAFVQGAVAR